MSLPRLISAAKHNALPDRAVAVSFDDGYADNLHVAQPMLEDARVPATVFVTTDYVHRPREFWWDELARLLLSSPDTLRTLSLDIAGQRYRRATATPHERLKAFRDISATLRRKPAQIVDDTLVQIRAWAGRLALGLTHDMPRPMTPSELQVLAKSKFIEIGAHSRTHPSLASQDRASQRAEIEGSRDDLQRWLGRPIPCFAYPFGEWGIDVTRTTRALVRAAGFECAVGVSGRPVTARSDPYHVPRELASAYDVGALKRQLERLVGLTP